MPADDGRVDVQVAVVVQPRGPPLKVIAFIAIIHFPFSLIPERHLVNRPRRPAGLPEGAVFEPGGDARLARVPLNLRPRQRPAEDVHIVNLPLEIIPVQILPNQDVLNMT